MKYILRNAAGSCLLILLFFGISYAQVNISIITEENAYKINAEFATEASMDIVRKTLTDYDRIPDYVPSIYLSKIIKRTNDYFILEQAGKKRVLLLFSKDIHLMLKVREESSKIYFEDILKKDFKVYSGHWEFRRTKTGTSIDYYLIAEPGFFVPKFIAKKTFVDEAKCLCKGITREIQRRNDQKINSKILTGN